MTSLAKATSTTRESRDMGWAGEKLANEIVGLAMGQPSVECQCGKQIVRLGDNEFWRLKDSGEVCNDGHWHKPIESTPPKPVEPTFSHMLAIYLTRNGQDSRYPSTEIVQYEIENYMYQCGVVVKKEDKR